MPRPHLPCPLGSDGPRPPRCSPTAQLPAACLSHACHCLGSGSHHPPTPQAFSSCLPSSHPTPTLWFAKVVSAFLLGPKIPYFFLELLPPTLLLCLSLSQKKKKSSLLSHLCMHLGFPKRTSGRCSRLLSSPLSCAPNLSTTCFGNDSQ